MIAGSSGKSYSYETQETVLFPTAGLVDHNELFNLLFSHNDVLVISLEKSVYENLMVGTSVAFSNFLGNKTTKFKNYPSFKAKYRLLNEGIYYPAIAIGINTENFIDIPINSTVDYHHSIGPYIVLSKAFSWKLGLIGFHLGANYPMDNNSTKKGNFFLGIEHTFSKDGSFAIEYDFLSSKNQSGSTKNGNINMALKYSIDRNVTFNFYLIDLFANNFNTYKMINIQFITNLNLF